MNSLIYTHPHPQGPGTRARAGAPGPGARGRVGVYINELLLINSYFLIKYSLIKYFNWT